MKKLLFIALLLIASLLTTAKSPTIERTVTRMVTVTDGAAVTAPLVVAVLAFISAGASLVVSSLSAFKLKQREYQNDYYKKVIDKRIKAIEAAEQLISLLSQTAKFSESGKHAHWYFVRELPTNKFEECLDERRKYKIWYSHEANSLYVKLSSLVAKVIHECKKATDKSSMIDIASSYRDEIDTLRRQLEVQLRHDMMSLHEVDRFFASTSNALRPAFLKAAGANTMVD